MQDVMNVNQKEYKIVKLLGHGKGGYSYLAEREGKFYVLKQIHHEPCEYYKMIITDCCRQESEFQEC